jgi:hypothetical protein
MRVHTRVLLVTCYPIEFPVALDLPEEAVLDVLHLHLSKRAVTRALSAGQEQARNRSRGYKHAIERLGWRDDRLWTLPADVHVSFLPELSALSEIDDMMLRAGFPTLVAVVTGPRECVLGLPRSSSDPAEYHREGWIMTLAAEHDDAPIYLAPCALSGYRNWWYAQVHELTEAPAGSRFDPRALPEEFDLIHAWQRPARIRVTGIEPARWPARPPLPLPAEWTRDLE